MNYPNTIYRSGMIRKCWYCKSRQPMTMVICSDDPEDDYCSVQCAKCNASMGSARIIKRKRKNT